MIPLILQLDISGNPIRWITYELGAYYYSKHLIAWSFGTDITLRGGVSRRTGNRSEIVIHSILAIRTQSSTHKQWKQINHVSLTNKTLFRRDKHVCAYCGNVFHSKDLTRDHILPSSRGGKNIWTNVVTACASCNKQKDNKTPEEANMDLLYVPYAPNKAEYLILSNRQVLSDQMDFLLKRVTTDSRLL